MSATLRLHHYTGYTYRGGATASYNEARMQPQSNPDQTVLYTKVEVSPHPWSMTWTDYWGTAVTSFEVHERHPELRVEATSTVTVDRRAVETDHLTWQQMAGPSVRDDWQEVLWISDRVAAGESFGEVVRQARESAATPAAFVATIGQRLRAETTYVRGRTSVNTRAQAAWTLRSAACQDLAHLMIGALRMVGIPARYVSGYSLPEPDPLIGQPYLGDSHAWVQWWDGAWVAYDPSNGNSPDDHYVEIGVGRDYKDVVPLSGIFTGAPGSSMFTQVEITRLA